MNKLIQLVQGHLRQIHIIIYVPQIHISKIHFIWLSDVVLKEAYEKTSVTLTHFGSHYDANNLVNVIPVKLKGGNGESKFCEAYQSCSSDSRAGLPAKKDLKCYQLLECVWWMCKQTHLQQGEVVVWAPEASSRLRKAKIILNACCLLYSLTPLDAFGAPTWWIVLMKTIFLYLSLLSTCNGIWSNVFYAQFWTL